MFGLRSNLGFPKRIVACYLVFCLLAASWLAVGVLMTSRSVIESNTTETSLARLGKTVSAVELEYLRNGHSNLRSILQSNPWLNELPSYSLVSPTGMVLAHSDESQVDLPAKEQQGELSRWGNVSGYSYQEDNGCTVTEYQVPLFADEEKFGSLCVVVGQPCLLDSLSSAAKVAPIAIALPLALVAVGAVCLVRLIKPINEVDSKLRKVALGSPSVDLKIEEIDSSDALSLGWNRIARALSNGESSGDAGGLEGRLLDVVSARGQGEMQKVLHSLSDGIAVTDVEGRITFANRAVAALLSTDTSDEKLDGLDLESQIVEASCDLESDLFSEETLRRPVVTEVHRQGEGEQRTLRVARRPMNEGDLQGHVWSVRDITQQKLAEKTRDQFIDVATHELRTPLSNIKAYAETLATSDAIEVEQQKEFCNIINGEVTRLARFVDDLLSISSMEAGSIVIDRQRTISARMFAEVLAKVKPMMNKKDLEFIVDLPEKMPDLELDKDKIVAVVVNLLGNAAKYTPESGRVTLRVKIDESQLLITVEDTGVGIAQDEVAKVFDKFFRSSDPRIQGETGTGLGLSLAREVVRMHGGDITVESQIDQGTTFMASIPIQ